MMRTVAIGNKPILHISRHFIITHRINAFIPMSEQGFYVVSQLC